MDRQIVYPGQIPLETDLLNTNRNTMIALGKLAAAIFGTTSNIVNGLVVVPTSPASLSVNVNAGEIYSLQNVDNTAYSSLPADTTDTVVKQGIQLQPVSLSCPAPTTAGFSINYLIEATYQDNDTGSVVLPYYNPSNPSQAYSGPNNSGTAQATNRQGKVVVQAKAGIAAATGSQTTPAVDAGYVALAVVTVANGQATITAGNISAISSSQVLTASLLASIQAAVPLSSAIASFAPTVGSMRNGTMTIGASTSSGTFTAEQIVVATSLGGQTYVLSNFNKTINLTTTGAGGMDTGSAPASGFVALYAIYNPTTGASAILAVNASSVAAPTIYGGSSMPSGYTASALISVWPTTSGSQFSGGYQVDRKIWVNAAVVLNTTTTQSSYTSFSAASGVPINARSISGYASVVNTAGNTGNTAQLAPAAGNFAQVPINAYIASNGGAWSMEYRDIPMLTPQTLYYTLSTTGGTCTFSVAIQAYTI